MAKGNELPDEVKSFIVQRLACWDTPSQVAKAVKEEFGLELPRQNVHAYDPTVRAGRDLSAKLRVLFEKARKAFLEDTSSIGIANKAVRLRALDRMARAAEDRGNILGAAQLIEQAAKECGGSYTNEQKLKHSGPNGEPLPAERTVIILPNNGRDGSDSAEKAATGKPNRGA